MTPPIGFRTGKTADAKNSLTEIRPPAALTDAAPTGDSTPHAASTPSSPRVADYAYRIAALTAGLVLLATVM